jgi:hypothetical protein
VSETELQVAVAVYLACYFDLNKSSRAYFKVHKDDAAFKSFFDDDFSNQEQ